MYTSIDKWTDDVGESEDELQDTEDEEAEEEADLDDVVPGGRSYHVRISDAPQDPKSQLTYNFDYLRGDEWGHIVQIIEERCPKALEQGPPKVAGQREIFLSELDSATFAEICQYAAKRSQKRRAEFEEDDERDQVELIDITGKRSKRKK